MKFELKKAATESINELSFYVTQNNHTELVEYISESRSKGPLLQRIFHTGRNKMTFVRVEKA